MQVVYEDNHIIVVYKESGEIVQGDKTGDTPLSETVKAYIKEKYQKPGAVFLGVVHRLDRPVSGLVVFARTSKALSLHNGQTDRYQLVEVELLTGRHHQIRCQLSTLGMPIRGDLKYGAKRSNPDGSISLLSHHVEFIHPVSKQKIVLDSPLPDDKIWHNIAFFDK